MCNCSVAIQVLPEVIGKEATFAVVDAVISYIQSFEEQGVRSEVGPFETTIEGDYDQLMKIVKECQTICIQAGAPGVMSHVKIHYRPDGVWDMDEKTEKHRQKEYV